MPGEGPGVEDPVLWPEDDPNGGAVPDLLSRTSTGVAAAPLTARLPVSSDLHSSGLLTSSHPDCCPIRLPKLGRAPRLMGLRC